MKRRVLLALFTLLCLGATLYNWHILRLESRYYPKLAIFAPCGAILFGAVSLFPKLTGPVAPEEKRKKYLQGAVLLLGLAAGLINWYAMAHS